ncbi:MAG: Holliday junction branch migration protein RuvA [Micavibrio sp. TMED27]|nr:Holliday junction branch migration protein RuvA [Micavibrio sp.]OUT90957.1 MAG: Holliday junction branch migration protein RuvA [Micavibrio sp. TMED27]|tara:strand:- start:431 stop:1063 length:633 start_codon:yes stop_codon:yes gene_type:complete
MIGKLTGVIDSFGETHVLLDVNGVGYLVSASRRTLSRIGEKGAQTSLLIDTNVREDAITLYGFADPAEQQWFRLLTSVQGVGAKAGLSILSVCPAERVALAIAAQDKAALTQADGVGPKLATRILTELKDKAVNMDLSSAAPIEGTVSTPAITNAEAAPETAGLEQDAVSALINLGYARSDAYSVVMRMRDQANDNLGELIRLSLKELSA